MARPCARAKRILDAMRHCHVANCRSYPSHFDDDDNAGDGIDDGDGERKPPIHDSGRWRRRCFTSTRVRTRNKLNSLPVASRITMYSRSLYAHVANLFVNKFRASRAPPARAAELALMVRSHLLFHFIFHHIIFFVSHFMPVTLRFTGEKRSAPDSP